MRSKSDEKKMVWSGYGHKALKIVRTKFRGRLVRMRSPVQIRIAAPQNTRLSMEKRVFSVLFATIFDGLNFGFCL